MAGFDPENLRIFEGTAVSDQRIVFDVGVGNFSFNRRRNKALRAVVSFLGNEFLLRWHLIHPGLALHLFHAGFKFLENLTWRLE